MNIYPTKTLLACAGVCAVGINFSTQTQAQTLLSHYVLNGNANDSGTLSADGGLVGGASFVSNAPGNYTSSLDLTGSGSRYLEANVGSGYDGLTQITLTLWINLQAAPSENDRLISNLEASSLDSFDLRFPSVTDPSAFKTNFNVNKTSNPALSDLMSADSAWTFIAVTYDSTLGSDQVSFYTGDEATSVSLLNSSTQTGSLDQSSLFRIGSTPASGADRTPPAYFSDVRVYDGILTSGQLETVRNDVFIIPEPQQYGLSATIVALTAMIVRRRVR